MSEQEEERPERCQTCRYYLSFGPCPPNVRPEDWTGGECRRHAPGKYTIHRIERLYGDVCCAKPVEVPFPPMPPQGWCGEYEAISLPAVSATGGRPKEVCGQCGQVIAEADDRALPLCLRCYMEARRSNP